MGGNATGVVRDWYGNGMGKVRQCYGSGTGVLWECNGAGTARRCRRSPKSFTLLGSGTGKKEAKIIRCSWKSVLGRF